VNQVSHLRTVDVSAAILSGNKGVVKKLQAVDTDIGLTEGKYRRIYSSPEALFASDHRGGRILTP